MNVLNYLNYSANYKGNFILSIEKLEKRIDSSGEFFFIFPEHTRNTNAIKWIMGLSNFFFCSKSFIYRTIEINRLIRKKRIDVYHLHFHTLEDVVIAQIVNILNPKLKIVVHFHNHPKVRKGIKSHMRRLVYHNLALVGVSKSVTEMLQKSFPVNRVYTVENAIGFERLRRDTSYEDVEDTLQEKITCLIFGFDYYRKGVDIAVEALDRLNKQEEKYILNVSLSTNFELTHELIQKQLGEFPDWINLMNARDDVSYLYNSSDIFLSPSREEGFCYSAVEAEYCRCAVVISDISAQKDLILPYAVHIIPNDVEALIHGIKSAEYQRIEKLKNIEWVKQKLENSYCLDAWVDEMISVYQEMIG